MHPAFRNLPGVTVQDTPAVLDLDVAAVRKSVELVLPAVLEDDILEEALPVQDDIPDLVIMRDEVDVRQAEARKPATVLRVHGLSGHFRMGINPVGAVHAPRAASHYDAVKVPQEVPEADLVDKLVLGRNVTAAENDPVRPFHEGCGFGRIAPVQHHDLRRPDPRSVDTQAHPLQDRLREDHVIRRRAHKQHPGKNPFPGRLRQRRLNLGQKSVVVRKMIFPIPRRASCQKQCHTGHKGTKKGGKPQNTAFPRSRRPDVTRQVQPAVREQ